MLNVSEGVARILKHFNIQLRHRTSCNIRNKLYNFLDNREPPYQADIVYRMSCNDCDAV